LPCFVFGHDCLIRGSDFVSKGESKIVAEVSVETCEELVEAGDCIGCHFVWFGWLRWRSSLNWEDYCTRIDFRKALFQRK